MDLLNNIKNRTWLVLILTLVVFSCYVLNFILNHDYNRFLLGIINLFLFHPLLIIASSIAIYNFYFIIKNNLGNKNKILVFFNLLIVLFSLYYFVRIIYVMFMT